jgi:hypothetical protein
VQQDDFLEAFRNHRPLGPFMGADRPVEVVGFSLPGCLVLLELVLGCFLHLFVEPEVGPA